MTPTPRSSSTGSPSTPLMHKIGRAPSNLQSAAILQISSISSCISTLKT